MPYQRKHEGDKRPYHLNEKMPYSADRKISEIKARDAMSWQHKMLYLTDKNGKAYSQTYLKTLHNQLSAIFNYAMKYYSLKENPAKQV